MQIKRVTIFAIIFIAAAVGYKITITETSRSESIHKTDASITTSQTNEQKHDIKKYTFDPSKPNTTASSALAHAENANTQTTPLQRVIDDALSPAGNANNRALALYFSLNCMTASGQPPATLDSVRAQNTGSLAKAEATLREVEQARKTVSEYCSTGNTGTFVDRLKQAGLPALGPVDKILAQWRAGPRNQDYAQAAIQILSNPNGFPTQFDTWLTRDLDSQLREKFGLSRNQSIYIQDTLYNEFTTTNNYTSFRVSLRCAQLAICPSSTQMTSDEMVRAESVASEVRTALQQQRWWILIPQ